ncbi:MAG: peptide-methionine (S)-S-oxide reductase MsrA [Planctomycetales bacterium]|nr:peptide-methionine (S)-S-oxide reductase MsrA [Planctomycetales bacterium]
MQFNMFTSIAYLLVATVCTTSLGQGQESAADSRELTPAAKPMDTPQHSNSKIRSVILAGGCFWCVESDMEAAPGVIKVLSGYTGGRRKNPTYETYASSGHREAVMVVYDPEVITYQGLVEFWIKHIDPTNGRGSFKDKGKQYGPAVYFETDEEKELALKVVKAVEDANVFRKKLDVSVEPRAAFWPAEDYHQDYHAKNPDKYMLYRSQSGRDEFVRSHWGTSASQLQLPGAFPSQTAEQPK